MRCDCFINALLTKDRGEVEGHLKKKRKKRGSYSAILTEQTWSIKIYSIAKIVIKNQE